MEDSSDKLVRVLAIWAGKSKYYSNLSTLVGLSNAETSINSDPSRAPRGRREVRPGLGRPGQRAQASAAGYVPNHGRDQPGAWNLRQAEPARSRSATARRASRCRRPPTSTPSSCSTVPNRTMKHVVRVVAHWALLTHIYVSMAGFTLALLFGVTGLTLNHQDFGFSEPRIAKSEITLDKELLNNPDQAALEQCLRANVGIRSPSTDYHDGSRPDPDDVCRSRRPHCGDDQPRGRQSRSRKREPRIPGQTRRSSQRLRHRQGLVLDHRCRGAC